MRVEYLTVDQVMELHNRAIQEFGGAAGLRSRELLESAVAMPQQSAFTYSHTVAPKGGEFPLAENVDIDSGERRLRT
jgi:hypothetical protein